MSHFNQVANTWDTPEKIEMYKIFAAGISGYLKRKEAIKILEVGCGTGLLGSQLLTASDRFIGVDTSDGMLEVFNQKFAENKNVHSQLINLEVHELQEKGFDLIISSMAFHHLKNPDKLILKLKKLLAPDGIIAVIDLDLEKGTFHADPKKMGVEHFGFSKVTTDSWGPNKREIIYTIKKENGDYPIFLAVYH